MLFKSINDTVGGVINILTTLFMPEVTAPTHTRTRTHLILNALAALATVSRYTL